MDVQFGLFKGDDGVDLQPHRKIITQCFKEHLADYEVEVDSCTITVLDYPKETISRYLVRMISEALMQYPEMQPYIHQVTINRLLATRK